jgi:hypothetical protein
MGIRTLQALGLAWDIKLAKIRQALPPESDVNAAPVADEAVA